MHNLPTTLEELLTAYQGVGIDLRALLSDAFVRLLAIRGHRELLQRRLLLVFPRRCYAMARRQAEAVAINGFVTHDISKRGRGGVDGHTLKRRGRVGKPVAPGRPR